MAIPAHPSIDRPKSAAEPARSARRATESNNGTGYRSERDGSIDQSSSDQNSIHQKTGVQRLRAMAEMMNPPASVAQTKARADEGLAASINQNPRVQALSAMAEMMNSPAPVAQTKQSEISDSHGLNPEVTQLKWIAGARPNLLMWDKLVDEAQWYYTLPDGRMFYSRDNRISDVLSRQDWLEMGASELEDDDGEVVNVHAQPQPRTKAEAQQPWRIVIEEAPSVEEFRQGAGHLHKEWSAKPATKPSEKEDYECSGADWTTVHEGVDVSKELAQNPRYTESCAIEEGISAQYVAIYAGGNNIPIALMMLETRQELPNGITPKDPHMYIRWLVGSPDRRGGGGALVEYAKIVAHLQGLARAVSVESAASAVDWYEKQGYTRVAASTHEDEDKPCRCVYLAWPSEAAARMHEEHTRLLAAKEARKKKADEEAEKSDND